MKDSLDRTGMKYGQNLMHWNVAPDVLPGSARLVYVLDHSLNDWNVFNNCVGGPMYIMYYLISCFVIAVVYKHLLGPVCLM